MPDSIKGRCIHYSLKPVDADTLFSLVDFIAEAEEFDWGEVKDSVIELCVREAYGSPRQAIANLAAVAGADTIDEAAELLRSAEAGSDATDLVKALLKGSGWQAVRPILQKLEEINPESVRHVCRGYLTKVLIGTEDPKKAAFVAEVLAQFSFQWNSGDGMTPVVMAVCGIVFEASKEPF